MIQKLYKILKHYCITDFWKKIPGGFLALLLVAWFFFRAVLLLVLAIDFFSTFIVEIQLGFEKRSLTTVDCFAITMAFSAASLIYKRIKKKNQLINTDHILIIRYSHIKSIL